MGNEGKMTIDASSKHFGRNRSTVEDKLDFLFRWCENLENTDINIARDLSSKIKEVQEAIKGGAG